MAGSENCILISDDIFSFSSETYHYRYRYGGRRSRYGYYGKRGMKKIASRQQTNNVHAELNDDSNIEHLKENFAEDKRHKAQLKGPH